MIIAIVRVNGQIGLREEIDETFRRLNLRKKYSCTVIRDKPELMGMLGNVRNFVAYGEIDKAMLVELIKKRGKAISGKKMDAEKIATEFIEGKTEKNFDELGIKNYFGLHPPRGGIETKKHYPKGVLGKHEKIAELIRRML
jgi:large subunit ribosomal protein L30